jgi:Tol biopolymer transport system component
MCDLGEVFEMVTKQTGPDLDPWTRQQMRQRRKSRNRTMGAIGLVIAMIAGGIVFAVTRDTGKQGALPPLSDTSPPGIPRQEPLGLAIIALDGTVRQELGLPSDAWMPDLSPDGSRIVFLTASTNVGFCGGCSPDYPHDRLAAVPSGEPAGVFIYLDEAGPIRRVEQPVWSPDGNQIAFVGVRRMGGDRDIYVARLQNPTKRPAGLVSAAVRRLTFDPAVDEFPAWSPDGSTIFYDNSGAEPLNDSGFSPTQEIWSVRAEGGTPERLTSDTHADTQADVAADGTVAFWRDGNIWTMDQQGGNQERLAAVPPDSGFNPRWSPDATMLALLRYDPTESASFEPRPGRPADLPLLEVVVVDLATGDVTTVGPRVAADFNPVSWTPDGSALLINRYDAGA